MPANQYPFQPGAILHDAIMGAFRASGATLEGWCNENGMKPSVARNCTYGQMRGPKGRAMLARLIEAAGPETVRVGYQTRLEKHLAAVARAAREVV